ncbi:hypothetical protein [Saccharothrix variisporea]|uniref:Uncharacterized protein n=1 Tax=Saccharothrix variisporea TaxID=543527 RepID=A0A495X9M7_9PSEU|nr:hypothetical protein [Saccharothrix variisporea]RKT69313.1 hypothetical protein DFJ66_2522 [Saccharothrix variisporea]
MASGEPLAVLEEEVRVEHGTFSLIDPDADYWRSEPHFTGNPIVTTDPHRIWFYSAGNDHYATVRVELWEARPPEITDADACESHTVSFTAARLCLATTVGGPVVHAPADTAEAEPRTHYLEVPTPGQFILEVTVHGRDAAADLEEATWARGVESWLIRMWPA